MTAEDIGEEVFCDCKKYQESARQIYEAQIRDTVKTGLQYTGDKFVFCPWCGRKLKKVKDKKE